MSENDCIALDSTKLSRFQNSIIALTELLVRVPKMASNGACEGVNKNVFLSLHQCHNYPNIWSSKNISSKLAK